MQLQGVRAKLAHCEQPNAYLVETLQQKDRKLADALDAAAELRGQLRCACGKGCFRKRSRY